jgi:hypothetical protein
MHNGKTLVCVCYAPNQTIKIIIHQLFSEELYTLSHTHTLNGVSLLYSLSLFNGICIHEMQLLNYRQHRRHIPDQKFEMNIQPNC